MRESDLWLLVAEKSDQFEAGGYLCNIIEQLVTDWGLQKVMVTRIEEQLPTGWLSATNAVKWESASERSSLTDLEYSCREMRVLAALMFHHIAKDEERNA